MSYSQERSESFQWVPRKTRKSVEVCRGWIELMQLHFISPGVTSARTRKQESGLWSCLGSPRDRLSHKGRGRRTVTSTNGWVTSMSPKLSTPKKVKTASVYKARWLCRPHVSLYVILQTHAGTYIEFWGVHVRDNYWENSLSLNNYETHE